MDTTNRIFFKNNPYPNGHKIKNFEWSGRLEPEKGLWFDFHLETDDYYAEDDSDDPEDFEPESDWKAKIVWGNYHKCTMSSTQWHFGGILVGTPSDKLDFENLASKTLFADTLPLPNNGWDYEDLAFHIYLLGHDSCANHEITFSKKIAADTFDIRWNGKIALTYVGDNEFKYEFTANIGNVKFAGFDLYNVQPEQPEQIEKLLEKFVVDIKHFEIRDNKIRIK